LIFVQPAGDERGADNVLGDWHGHPELRDFTAYALMLQCTTVVDGFRVTASFNGRVLESTQQLRPALVSSHCPDFYPKRYRTSTPASCELFF
jgi:hypothetical protein